MKYKTISVKKLVKGNLRDVRENVVEELMNRISKSGYNPAKPLSVKVLPDGKYLVADGNHRLSVIKKLKITSVPCVIYGKKSNEYEVGVRCNRDEDTYAPMDMFDYLDVVKTLKGKGFKQKEIGKTIGWSREKVRNYNIVLDKIGTKNLEIAKKYQDGRVPTDGTMVPIEFTERWFREILKLSEKNQERVIKEHIESEGILYGQRLVKQVKKLQLYEKMVKHLKHNLVDKSDIKLIKKDIYDGIYHTMDQLKKYVEQLNDVAKNKLINGDCLEELVKLDDKSISLLVTDPPYGIDYKSNRRILVNKVTVKVKSDENKDKATKLFKSMLKIAKDKLVDDAHLYIFCSWKNYPEFRKVIEKYYEIKSVLVWNKGNHGAGDMEGYAEQYELIIFAGNGTRLINPPRPINILEYAKVSSSKLEHPMQKPVELIQFLIEKSTSPGEYVLDPFMGVGSTIKACGDRNPYVGIEIEKRYYKIAMRDKK